VGISSVNINWVYPDSVRKAFASNIMGVLYGIDTCFHASSLFIKQKCFTIVTLGAMVCKEYKEQKRHITCWSALLCHSNGWIFQ